MTREIELYRKAPSETGTARVVLLLAAGLSGATLAYHFISGTAEVMMPLYAAGLPAEVVGVIDVVWYDMALLAGLGGIGMVVAAYRQQWRLPLAWFIGGHYLVLALLCLAMSFIWFGNPLGLIQWAIFAPLGLMTIWAARA